MDFRLWLENARQEYEQFLLLPSLIAIEIWDSGKGAHGAGGDYDNVSPES